MPREVSFPDPHHPRLRREMPPEHHHSGTRHSDYQLVEAPSWTRSERFDIVVKCPEGDGRGRVPEMVQALHADRFAFKVHKDTREGAIFELVTARSDGRLGPKLRRSEVDCVAVRTALKESGRVQTIGPGDFPTWHDGIASDRFIKGGNRTMDVFSRSLARYVDRRVVDRTGLDGEFDIELEWLPATGTAASNPTGAPRSSPDDTLSIYTALREQLGLELKSTRCPIRRDSSTGRELDPRQVRHEDHAVSLATMKSTH